MSDFRRIDRLIREARVQRSAEIGMAIGDFLADSWLGAAAIARKASAALRPGKAAMARVSRTAKALPAR